MRLRLGGDEPDEVRRPSRARAPEPRPRDAPAPGRARLRRQRHRRGSDGGPARPEAQAEAVRDDERRQGPRAGRTSWSAAVALMRQVIGEDPKIMDAHLTLGNWLVRLKRSARARSRRSRQALSLKPDDDISLGNLAQLYRARGRTEDELAALEVFRSALRVNPKNPQSWYQLATLYLDAKRLDDAAAAFKDALAANPKMGAAYNGLGVDRLRRAGPRARGRAGPPRPRAGAAAAHGALQPGAHPRGPRGRPGGRGPLPARSSGPIPTTDAPGSTWPSSVEAAVTARPTWPPCARPSRRPPTSARPTGTWRARSWAPAGSTRPATWPSAASRRSPCPMSRRSGTTSWPTSTTARGSGTPRPPRWPRPGAWRRPCGEPRARRPPPKRADLTVFRARA